MRTKRKTKCEYIHGIRRKSTVLVVDKITEKVNIIFEKYKIHIDNETLDDFNEFMENLYMGSKLKYVPIENYDSFIPRNELYKFLKE